MTTLNTLEQSLLKNVLLDIPNACNPTTGLCSGGKPNAQQLQSAFDKGICCVINLCPPAEMQGFDEAGLVTALGMHYVNIPIAGAMDLTKANAQKLAAAFAEATPNHPVLLHCASGNRAGALLALKAFFVDGLSKEQAVHLGLSAGLTGLLPDVQAVIENNH